MRFPRRVSQQDMKMCRSEWLLAGLTVTDGTGLFKGKSLSIREINYGPDAHVLPERLIACYSLMKNGVWRLDFY